MSENLSIKAKDNFPAEGELLVALSEALDGSEGTNRNRTPGVVKQIDADNDLEAIETWLKLKRRKSENTQRSYRKEAQRLLAWAIFYRSKPLSSINLDDILDFHKWLQHPTQHPELERRGWSLCKKEGLSDSSRRQAMVILGGFFRWLCDAGYLSGNPFRLFDDGTDKKEKKEAEENKVLPAIEKPIWDWIFAHIDDLRPTGDPQALKVFERSRFIVVFLYFTGLRRSELATATMGNTVLKRRHWVLKVHGKGRKLLEPVLLLPPAIDALSRYRQFRGLSPLPDHTDGDIPVVSSTNGKKKISDHYINTQIKNLFAKLASEAKKVDPSWEARLNEVTAHWFRHTLATHNAEAGVPMQATATQLRHKSLDTTRRVYTHVEQMDQQAKDLGKLLDYK